MMFGEGGDQRRYGQGIPFSGSFAVCPWARVPDGFVRHVDVGCVLKTWMREGREGVQKAALLSVRLISEVSENEILTSAFVRSLGADGGVESVVKAVVNIEFGSFQE